MSGFTRFIPLACVFCMLGYVYAQPTQGGQAEADLKLMQGKWVVITAAADGKEFKKDKSTVTFEGNVMTTREGERVESQASFTLDLSKTPRAVDFNLVGGDRTPFLGIYEFKDDQLKLCFSLTAQDRPTAFITAAGKDHALVIMKRMK